MSYNPKEAEVVITRPSATALLGISSTDRYKSWGQSRTNPSNPFRFTIQKNESIMPGFFKRLALSEFRMNWTLPNFAQAWGNNIVNFSYIHSSSSTFTFPVVIPDGFYGAEELATALQTAIQLGNPSASTPVAGIPGFLVLVQNWQENDTLAFPGVSGYTFWFTPTTQPNRQLFDMLALPTMSTPGIATMTTGVPDLRATEYVDLVCSNLTGNMTNRDSTSAPITRDMIARIYLDDDVPSQAIVSTQYFTTTALSTAISASILLGATEVQYTIASSTPITAGESVVVSGITGGIGYNTTAFVEEVVSSTVVIVSYAVSPVGTPSSYSGALMTSPQGGLTQTSKPITTWDDRVNGITPFVLYRQFPYPKQIRWNNNASIANMTWEMFDSQGRSLADLWAQFGPGRFQQQITAQTTTGNSVSLTFGSTAGMNVGQLVNIGGFIGSGVKGYNSQAVITSIPNATSVVVNYTATLAGTPTLTYATIQSLTDYQGSFAWNASLLCSED